MNEFCVYFLKSGAVKVGDPFKDLGIMDKKFPVYCTICKTPNEAISDYFDSLELPQFMREKIVVV